MMYEKDMVVMSANEALLAMQAGEVPPRLRVEGNLSFYQQGTGLFPRALPAEELTAGSIIIHDASHLEHWPHVVRCQELFLTNFKHDFPPGALLEIDAPKDRRYRYTLQLYLQNCLEVTHLPELRCTTLRELRLVRCIRLRALSGGLLTDELNVIDCPGLSRLPDRLHASRVSLSGCTALTGLPDDFVAIEALNLANCAHLASLPDDLETLRVNIANCSSLTALPQHLRALYIDMSGCT